MWPNSKTQNVTKLKNSKFDLTQTQKMWQNSKTQMWPNKKKLKLGQKILDSEMQKDNFFTRARFEPK